MKEKDLIEFFIYLRDNCYNRDFNMEPKRVVECFYEYRNAGYKLPIHDVSGQSEQFVCGANRVMGEKRCERQCGQCEELYPQTNCH